MAMDWFSWYPADYRRNTRHFTLAEHGAYRALIDEYMTSRTPLQDDDRALASICGCGLEEWRTVAARVREKFESSSGKLVHERCEQEIHAQSMLRARRHEQAKQAAHVMWKNKRLDADSNAASMQAAMLNDATLHKKDIPLLNSEPREKPMLPDHELKPTPELLKILERQNRERGIAPARSATALPAGAPPSPVTAKANGKAPHRTSKEELEAIYAARKPKEAEVPFD